ncbi:hypothetical protein GCM10009801_12280 [Streptomyces albiaxialis]|uniref:Transferase n=1 Tax=Streptomyces albiaxialis TaxID=329523 RepID=A0ABN2VMG8_9ACTN
MSRISLDARTPGAPRPPRVIAASPFVPAPPAPAPTPLVPAPGTPGPYADCTADGAGGLVLDVPGPGGSGGGGACGADGGAVLLRKRHGRGAGASLRLPLTATADGALRAVLPGTTRLREGRWDVYLALPDDVPRRLLPGVCDLRTLAGAAPGDGGGDDLDLDLDPRSRLNVRIPYTTKHGNLSIRAWLRYPHAEAGALLLDDGALVLRGRVYGTRLAATARLEARSRDASVPPVRVPVRASPGPPDRGFCAALLFDALLPGGPGDRVRDLWLRPSEEGEPVRVGRILDDVPDKKQIFAYPARHVEGPEGAVHAVRPYYTVNNNLSVRVSDEGRQPGAARAGNGRVSGA